MRRPEAPSFFSSIGAFFLFVFHRVDCLRLDAQHKPRKGKNVT